MSRVRKMFMITLIFLLGISSFPFSSQAATSYVSATKTANPSSILVGGETEVTLNIQGSPPVNVVKPNDVILVIDKSGSMGQEKMNNAKAAAKGFIDLMDLSKHQVGIVDYQSSPSAGVALTNDAKAVKSYIDTIFAGGGTGTASAIDKARELLESHRPEAQPVIVLLTDGDATEAGDGLSAYDYTLKKAEEAKNAGVVFYTIALLDQGTNPETSGPNKLMKDMATTSHHHHFVLGSTGLSDIYAAIVKEIGLASAYDVVVTDIVPDNFEIVPDSYNNNIPKPIVSGNTLTWNFLELKKDTLSFTYKIRQKQGGKNGTFPVTQTGSAITYKDYTGAKQTYRMPSTNVEVKYLPPIITSLTPDKGPLAGGDTVTITGENFLPDAKVYVLGKLITGSTVVNDKEINFTTPVGKQGPVEVKVVNPDSQSAASTFSYYVNPEVTSISPNNGPVDGGTSVKIYGKYFMPGVTVKFGDQKSVVTYNNDTYLFARTPAVQNWGTVDVTFENPDGTSVVVKDGFTYNEPPKITLTGINPAEGLTTGNEEVTLTGTEFKTGMKVYFNSVEVPVGNLTATATQSLKIKTPAWNQPEAVDVKVVSADGKEAVLAKAYTYLAPPPPPAPTIDTVSPNTTRVDQSILTYIDGSNFVLGAKVDIGDTKGIEANFISDKRLRVKTPLATEAASVDVKVTNPDGQFALKSQAFTYQPLPEAPAPTITAVTPGNSAMTGGLLIYIDGSNFQSGIKLDWIESHQVTSINPEFINSNRLRMRVPATTIHGSVDIKVSNPDNKEALKVAAFTYDAPPVYPDPILTSVTPNSGNKSGGGIVDIVGDEFQKGLTVKIGSQEATLYAFVDKTRVRVKVPSVLVAESVDVVVTNPDGKSITLPNAYTYEDAKPEITGLSPSNGPLAGGTLVYIDGRYMENGLTVTFNGTPVNVEYISASRVRIKTPQGAAPGPVDVVVTNPSGASVTTMFTYDLPPVVPAPILSKLSLTSGPVSGGTLIYLDGSNFQSGAKVTVDGNDYEVTYINSTRLRIRMLKVSAPGSVAIKIINPDGQESGTLNYEYK
ncbi:IPT/TIG domain-containing protein [Paenibacillus illinoisensis]|uniref:von Willebrand factor type A n=1 Tax=Paenibacillus illinoisensis TaxID=59845 RepID=A0A2W0CPH9_9BACL|nr:IPT/TIG domain-containing protein [Paenibacillus illinoisensis]PYY29578.1 von Willebrand factor type A [Paenibacillus illinoisensis]